MSPEQPGRSPSALALAALARIVRSVPRRLALAWGERIGLAAYHLARRSRRHAARLGIERAHRRTAMKDIELALGTQYPRRELAGIVRDSFRNAGRTFLEVLRIPAMSSEELLSLVDAPPLDPLERTLARGKGAIVLSAHLGTWELGAACVSIRFDVPMCAIVQKLRSPAYDTLINDIRRSSGLRVITQEEGARPALRVLRRNGLLFVLGDIDMPQVDGAFVDFFGRPAYTPTGPAALSRLTGASIVPMFMTWKGLRHRGHVLPEIEPVRTGDRDADVLEMTRRWSRAVENMIRRYPGQWVWFHRRWRTRPPSEGT